MVRGITLFKGDITKSQSVKNCGKPEVKYTKGLLDELPTNDTAPTDWYEMMKEIWETHPDFMTEKAEETSENTKPSKKKKNSKKKGEDRDAGFDVIENEEPDLGDLSGMGKLAENDKLDLENSGFDWIIDDETEKEVAKHRDFGGRFSLEDLGPNPLDR